VKKPTRLLRLPEVLALTGYSEPSVWRLIKEGKFPKPVHLCGGRAASWPEHEVVAVVEAAIAARDAPRSARRRATTRRAAEVA
jgi:prophage regulatory protein